MKTALLLCLSACLPWLSCCRSAGSDAAAAPGAIDWQTWSAAAFTKARAEHKLVLLDLGAEWCHWCHVMEGTTYADVGVRTLLATHYVAIEADADRRLDLATRYQDYGWPATIVFDAEGRELWKNRGYVPPPRMRAVLQKLVEEPVPIAAEDVAQTTELANGLDAAVRATLLERMDALHDEQHGGFGFVHKYLDLAGVEWLLQRARGGSAVAKARVLRWLDAERALHDPVWGGAYQYSHGGVWENPHFEKVMVRQLADLRAYALAFGAFGREPDLTAARGVARYLTTMLQAPGGAFFASQDADVVRGEHAAEYFALDDAGRRARGLPHIETSQWSRENGQAIQGLCALLAVAPDAKLQRRVMEAATWIVAHRQRSDGLFAHGERDEGGPFLIDTLELVAAFAALHEVTMDRQWLDRALAGVHAIEARFGDASRAGFATAIGDGVLPPVVDRNENVQLARVANRVHHATGDARARAIAERALAAVVPATVALQPGLPADLLLAAAELESEPTHVVVVGAVADAAAAELFATALRLAPGYRVVEWLVPGETGLGGAQYPVLQHAVAFVCANGACSAPFESVAQLRERLHASEPR